uniref:Uncharacterized protein n=1 Tax=Arundo donax TaxID=35708 RepID=A0A0A9HAH5_ARUDO
MLQIIITSSYPLPSPHSEQKNSIVLESMFPQQ